MALTEEKLNKLPPKAREFWRKAFAFVTRDEDWFWVQADSAEFEAWARYFYQQKWEPFAIRQIRERKLKQITMPARWPEWFDTKYLPLPKAAE